MTKRALVLLICALPLAMACSDDDGDGAGSDAGSGAESDAGASGDGAVAGSATISGLVARIGDDDNDGPVAGATLTLRDSSPLVQTTSSSSGAFSLSVPANQLIMAEAAKTDLISSIYTLSVPPAGFSGIEVSLLLPAAADSLATEGLSLASRDTSKGMVIVEFDLDGRGDTAVGSEKAEISATAEASAVFDANDNGLAGDTLIVGGGTEVVFFNVEPGSTTVTISGSGCSADLPASTSYPVEADKLTWIFATCGTP